MNDLVLVPSGHYSSTVHLDVKAICSDFFNSSDISVFLHVRSFDDGGCVALTNVPIWNEYHLNNHYTVCPPVPGHLLSKQFYFIIDENSPFNEVSCYLRNLFNIYDPFYLFRRQRGYFDMFCFAQNLPETGAINNYINQYDILNKFVDYFLLKSRDIYNAHLKNKILIPQFMRAPFGGLDCIENIMQKEKAQFLERISSHLFDIQGIQQKVGLTRRECEIIYYISKGMTAKEIANELEISSKTVEWHILNAKGKMGVYKRSAIFLILRNI